MTLLERDGLLAQLARRDGRRRAPVRASWCSSKAKPASARPACCARSPLRCAPTRRCTGAPARRWRRRGRSARSTTSPSTRAAGWPSRETAAASGIACSSPSSTCSPNGRRWPCSKTCTGPTRRRSTCCAMPAGASPARVRCSSRAFATTRSRRRIRCAPCSAIWRLPERRGWRRSRCRWRRCGRSSAGTGVDAAALHSADRRQSVLRHRGAGGDGEGRARRSRHACRTRCWRAPDACRRRPAPCSTRPRWPGRAPRPGCCAS